MDTRKHCMLCVSLCILYRLKTLTLGHLTDNTLQTRSSVAEKAGSSRRRTLLSSSLAEMHARGCADRFSWTKELCCECGHELYTTCGAASSPLQGRHTPRVLRPTGQAEAAKQHAGPAP